ncbi:hypothetical protein FACS1894190_11130 [Spirochaetia bacterium]|nr:hypothetical protein FACS1894190_11130 [Spirochaetia bacterium]
MKKSKLFLVGMIAAFVAGSLFMTGCEGPAGPAGAPGANASASAQQAAELAAFGYTFGDPIHVTVGRDAVYANSIVGAAPLPTSDPVITGIADAPVAIVFGKRSVTFNLNAAAYTHAELLAVLNGALGSSGGDLGLTADFITTNEPGGAKNYLRIKANGALPAGNDGLFGVVTQTAGGTDAVEKLFGQAGSGGMNIVYNPQLAVAQPDEWVYPIVADDLFTGVTSANSILTVGNVKLPVPVGATPAAVVTDLVEEINAQIDQVIPVYAYTDYTITDGTGGLINAPGIKFSASVIVATPAPHVTPTTGPRAFDVVARRPTISTSVLDPYLDTYGYTLITHHVVAGATLIPATPPAAASPSPSAVATTDISGGSLSAIGTGAKITVSYGDLTDVFVFPTAATNPIVNDTVLYKHTGQTAFLTEVSIKVTAGKIGFFAPQSPAVKTFSVVGTGGGITGTGGLIDGLATTQGVAYAAGVPERPPAYDTWKVTVISGNSSIFPTVASKLAITPAGTSTINEKLVGPNQFSRNDIANLFNGLKVDHYTAISSITNNIVDITGDALNADNNLTIAVGITGVN